MFFVAGKRTTYGILAVFVTLFVTTAVIIARGIYISSQVQPVQTYEWGLHFESVILLLFRCIITEILLALILFLDQTKVQIKSIHTDYYFIFNSLSLFTQGPFCHLVGIHDYFP